MDNRTHDHHFGSLPAQGMASNYYPDNFNNKETEGSFVSRQIDENDATGNKNDSYQLFDNTYPRDVDLLPDKEMGMLMTAFQQACASKQPTPLLKYELRCVIQARRLTQGMDELAVQFMSPTAFKLSAAELEQATRRRRQNRLAAQRCRQKRKISEEMMMQKRTLTNPQTIQHLQQQNQQLQRDANLLRQEKQLLMETVVEHLLHCPCLSQISLEASQAGGVP